jgi:hypothetical protein
MYEVQQSVVEKALKTMHSSIITLLELISCSITSLNDGKREKHTILKAIKRQSKQNKEKGKEVMRKKKTDKERNKER